MQRCLGINLPSIILIIKRHYLQIRARIIYDHVFSLRARICKIARVVPNLTFKHSNTVCIRPVPGAAPFGPSHADERIGRARSADRHCSQGVLQGTPFHDHTRTLLIYLPCRVEHPPSPPLPQHQHSISTASAQHQHSISTAFALSTVLV